MVRRTTHSLKPRKSPHQRRARQTVDAIIEATARILVKRGWAETNTNIVARQAGVSVGSLYQYFPNKESLIVALNRRHAKRVHSLVELELRRCAGKPLEAAVAALVHVIVTVHLENPELDRMLETELSYFDVPLEERKGENILDCASRFFEEHRLRIVPQDMRLVTDVVMTIIESLVNRLFFHYSGNLTIERREKVICSVVLGYLSYRRNVNGQT